MDTKRKLDIAFLWHMHQPYYKDPHSGKYLMPWVRLHGVKDYFPMAAILEKFDHVRVAFNMVPVLMEQINDYARNNASDLFLDLTLIRASDLTSGQKVDILNNFFRVNYKHFIESNPRYAELLIKRGVRDLAVKDIRKAAFSYSTQDFLDLQVLFNMAWFHSISIEEDVNLGDIVAKGKGYTEEDKNYIVFKQREIMGQILPLLKRLQDKGRIEITTTPYYHPILPLLCDTSVAHISAPAMKLPHRFSHPEDAQWHLKEAASYYAEQFGREPRGMWPSEGSVSKQVLELIAKSGISWIAADEDILFKTLHLYDKKFKGTGAFDRRLVYQPYRFKSGKNELDIVFRDKNLSNMISFSYNSWDPVKAAEDLVGHFKNIGEHLRHDASHGIAAIVMDGENAWEYYPDNGRKFFETLYGHLDDHDSIKSNTIGDYLRSEPARKTIKDIFPGSWINHDFEVWIGQEQDNVSWEYLARTRKDLEKFAHAYLKKDGCDSEVVSKAWRELHIAEGSDWNWWYNGKAHTGGDNPFDPLYRMHLKNVYKLFKKPIPDFLKISIA